MEEKLKLSQAVIVEGRYDKSKVSEIVDAFIIETNGFGIFKDKKKLSFIKKLAMERGVIILTDSDHAGFMIRNYLSSGIPKENVINAYIPDVYGKESIVVDTHMIRISNRIGLVNVKDPVKIERELKKVVPAEEGAAFCHRIVLFGREYCPARKPKCETCPMEKNCKRVGVK